MTAFGDAYSEKNELAYNISFAPNMAVNLVTGQMIVAAASR